MWKLPLCPLLFTHRRNMRGHSVKWVICTLIPARCNLCREKKIFYLFILLFFFFFFFIFCLSNRIEKWFTVLLARDCWSAPFFSWNHAIYARIWNCAAQNAAMVEQSLVTTSEESSSSSSCKSDEIKYIEHGRIITSNMYRKTLWKNFLLHR